MDINQVFQEIQELQEQKATKNQMSEAVYDEIGKLIAEMNELQASASAVSKHIDKLKEEIMMAKNIKNPWDEFNLQNIAAQVEITLIDEGIKKIDNEILKVNKAKSADRTDIRLYEREVERLNSLKRDLYKRKQKILTEIAELKEATKTKIVENAEVVSNLYEERNSNIEDYRHKTEEIKSLRDEISEKKINQSKLIEDVKRLKLTIDKKKTDYENGLIEAHVPEEYREKCRIIVKKDDHKIDILFGKTPYYGNDPKHGHICIDMDTGNILFYREYGKRF